MSRTEELFGLASGDHRHVVKTAGGREDVPPSKAFVMSEAFRVALQAMMSSASLSRGKTQSRQDARA